jgi:integrase
LVTFDTKTGARRTIPVSPRLKEVLERRSEGLESEDIVFTTKGGKPFRKQNMDKSLKAICGKAGIVYGDKEVNKKGERIGIVFHCFRHTRTSKWVEMGFSDEIVRRATGHKTLEAYQQYVKLDPNAVMRLVEDKNPKTDKNGIKSSQTLYS